METTSVQEQVDVPSKKVASRRPAKRRVGANPATVGLGEPVRRILKAAYVERFPQGTPLISKAVVGIYQAQVCDLLSQVSEKAFEGARLAKRKTVGESAVRLAFKLLHVEPCEPVDPKLTYKERGLELPEAKVRRLLKNGRAVGVTKGAVACASKTVQEFVRARASEALTVSAARKSSHPTVLKEDVVVALKGAATSEHKRRDIEAVHLARKTKPKKQNSDGSKKKKVAAAPSLPKILLVAPHPYFAH